ncbi:hypothetical protein [Thermogemmatispora onikobensis]|uniref:hypothetical protein n=1 Tax=Thermogemmatispora onikobensis TaxID=732234 RepID=UPI00085307EC|nr:hypothetical protein [Thermogemmatispora onikobensis]
MRAAAVAFVLVAAAAVVLWFGNTLNSWVLGGLIGGLAALLLSIPISLSLFSFLSRRHDEYLRAELQTRMALETTRQSPPPASPHTAHPALLAGEAWRGQTRYTQVAADEELLDEGKEWVFAEGEEESDSNSGYVTFDDEEPEEEMVRGRGPASAPFSSRLSRSLSRELPARSPSSVPLQTRSTGRNSSALQPQTRIEGLRAQPPLGPGGYRLPPAAAGPAYPGMARPQAGNQRRQSQYFAEALRTARLEALRQQEEALSEENVEVSPMLPPPPPRLAARRSSSLAGQRPASTQQHQPQRSQPLAQSERSAASVSATTAPSQRAGRHLPLAAEADDVYDDSLAPLRDTGKGAVTRPSAVEIDGSSGRARATGQQRLLRSSPSGSLRNPLVRRPPYLYEDDPLRAELSQFAEEPITRRSSRLRRFPTPDED